MSHISSSRGAGSPDGRRNNKPPEHGKIRRGEVRNPYGRAGKPKNALPTEIDRMFWREASRTVSHDEEGPVHAGLRMIQEEFFDALAKSDPAARVRVIAQLRETAQRMGAEEREERDQLEHFMERKVALTEEFYLAKKFQKPPPEVTPHPDHVQVSPTDLAINGPLDAESRKIWEQVKLALRVTACQHRIIREEYRRNPSEAVQRELKAIESHRRRLMRTVPKGWNWQEEVYCRDSMLDLAKEIVHDLERIGYVSSNADD